MAKLRANRNGTLPSNSERCKDLPSTPDSVPALPSLVWERLHAQVEKAPSDSIHLLQQQLLQELGRHLRSWRLRQGLTRQELAERLQMEVGWLLVVERGLAQPGDITAEQLSALTSLLAEQGEARTLREAIETYLSSLTK